MNSYHPYLSDVIKEFGHLDNTKLTKNDIYRFAVEFGNPELMSQLIKRYAAQLGYMGVTNKDFDRMAGDGSTILTLEAISLFNSVVINVEDASMVKALLRTNIDAVGEDLRLPFPIMEFNFPSGIDMGDGLQVNGALVFDMENFDINKEYSKYGIEVLSTSNKSDRPKAHIAVLSRLRDQNGEDKDVCIHRFCRDQILGDYGEYLPDRYADFIKKTAVLMTSILLYLQCYTEQKEVLVKSDHPFKMAPGIPSAIAKIGKRRSCYHIRDLLEMGKQYDVMYHGGSHASPSVHWRTWVLRSLRHPKYRRNPDGSVRIILVKPCIVGKHDDDEAVHGIRAIKSHEEETA